jgi:hypothetical protein
LHAWLARLRAELSLDDVRVTPGGKVEITAGRPLTPDEQQPIEVRGGSSRSPSSASGHP